MGEGNSNPLLYSCLENPMDGGAWWAAVHGVAKSQKGLRIWDYQLQIIIYRMDKQQDPTLGASLVVQW